MDDFLAGTLFMCIGIACYQLIKDIIRCQFRKAVDREVKKRMGKV
jgi:hypothetical protein